NQESRLPPGSDFRRWVWSTIAPFVTAWHYVMNLNAFSRSWKKSELMVVNVRMALFLTISIRHLNHGCFLPVPTSQRALKRRDCNPLQNEQKQTVI
ncbi:hypothetical protein, partial [Klebsiella aerogenes]|uniref:hypothetical protein n=1 Tax=Klebsiella aerogenes TaxID=548 RepID=UPI0023A9901F